MTYQQAQQQEEQEIEQQLGGLKRKTSTRRPKSPKATKPKSSKATKPKSSKATKPKSSKATKPKKNPANMLEKALKKNAKKGGIDLTPFLTSLLLLGSRIAFDKKNPRGAFGKLLKGKLISKKASKSRTQSTTKPQRRNSRVVGGEKLENELLEQYQNAMQQQEQQNVQEQQNTEQNVQEQTGGRRHRGRSLRSKSPAKLSKSPAKRSKSPAKRAKSPAKRSKSPAKRAKSPAKRAKSPAKHSKGVIGGRKSPKRPSARGKN